jgi:stage III sporulation protein AA
MPCRKWLHIGGGSNLLFVSDYDGVVLHSCIQGYEVVSDSEDEVLVRVGAGVTWDDFVSYAVSRQWYGAENLSLIPGEVGASAVQNIGAYGVEAKDLIVKVEALEVATGKECAFSNAECRYAYRESINRGYLTLEGGIRVGLCGRALMEKEGGRTEVMAVRDIDALCIRFPHAMRRVGERLIPLIRAGFPQGTLLYSPPGVGKTTLLRALAQHFSLGERALRTAVVDSRCEINDGGFDKECQLCVLSGYPKGQGIEIAVRSMNAQVVLCDEIGNAEEAQALLSAANCGVPVIATAHAADIRHLLVRPGFDMLHLAGVFAHYVRLTRRPGALDFEYDISTGNEG